MPYIYVTDEQKRYANEIAPSDFIRLQGEKLLRSGPEFRLASDRSVTVRGNRVVFFCDELGTMPPFDILPLFSAGRSQRLMLVPIIQSLAQLDKNYGKEGAEILMDNCQDTIFGGFAPQSKTAEALSKALDNRTVLAAR